jgi:hypothetical protein
MNGRPILRRRAARAALVAACLILSSSAGCGQPSYLRKPFGYSFQAPYSTEIKTVYVPVFRSITFRRDVNLQLTELIIKEIERRTPYKVVAKKDEADTILDGTINFADKNLMVENPFNYPRQLQAQLNCSINWYHNPPNEEELERGPTTFYENINFVPEIGETSMTAFYRANQVLAKQVVDAMEKPW